MPHPAPSPRRSRFDATPASPPAPSPATARTADDRQVADRQFGEYIWAVRCISIEEQAIARCHRVEIVVTGVPSARDNVCSVVRDGDVTQFSIFDIIPSERSVAAAKLATVRPSFLRRRAPHGRSQLPTPFRAYCVSRVGFGSRVGYVTAWPCRSSRQRQAVSLPSGRSYQP